VNCKIIHDTNKNTPSGIKLVAKLRLDHAEAQKNKAKGRGKQGIE
jgi:hypothetical protein